MRKFILFIFIQKILPRLITGIFHSKKVTHYARTDHALSAPTKWATKKRPAEWEGIIATALFLGAGLYNALKKKK